MSFEAVILLGLLEGNHSLNISRVSEWTKWDVLHIRALAEELSHRGFAVLDKGDALTVRDTGLAAIKRLKEKGLDAI